MIAKLDRLARNVHFITGLLESGVKFVAADDPDLDIERNPEYVQLKAVIAEREARAISQRTKEALAEARENGVVLGNAQPGRVKALRDRHGDDFFTRVGHRGGERAGQVHRRNFEDHYGAIVPIVRDLLAEDRTFQEICDRLNEEGYCTSKGNDFTVPTLARVVRRYQLRDDDHDYRAKPRTRRKARN